MAETPETPEGASGEFEVEQTTDAETGETTTEFAGVAVDDETGDTVAVEGTVVEDAEGNVIEGEVEAVAVDADGDGDVNVGGEEVVADMGAEEEVVEEEEEVEDDDDY